MPDEAKSASRTGGRNQRGMGRGLAAILSASGPPEPSAEELRELPVELIEPNRRQPRNRFDDETLQGLADSIRARGVLQPVLVRQKPSGSYELIAGERRLRAARLAGVERIPAVVRAGTDAEALELALIENMAREDLNPVDEARACAALVEELGLSREEVGLRVGRSRVAVSNLLRLLDLPDEALRMLEEGRLSEGHGRALLLAEDHAERRRLARDAAEGGWSVRVLEQRSRQANSGDLPIVTPRAGRGRSRHPDEEAACASIADALGTALGADVKVSRDRNGRYAAELSFASLDEALAFAQRLRPRAVA